MKRYPTGFSLLELLVAISVVAIIAGLAIVSMPKVRNTSDRVAAAASMRAIGTAILSYANDNHGKLPGPLYYSQGPRYKKDVPGLLGYYLWSYLGSPEPASSWQECEAINNPAYLSKRPSETSPAYIVQRNVYMPGQSGVSPFGYPAKESPLSMNALMEYNLREEWALQDLDQEHPDVATWNKSNLVSEPVHGDVRMTLFFDWHVEAVPVED